jgi:hypothetical protein
MSWASIVDLTKLLLLNTYYSIHAKECDHWKILLEIVPITSFHRYQECVNHPCASLYYEDPRIYPTFKDLSPYVACTKLMPVAQKYVEKLLYLYDLTFNPKCSSHRLIRTRMILSTDEHSNLTMRNGIRRIGEQYPERWLLFHTIISLDMVAHGRDRGMKPQLFPYYHSENHTVSYLEIQEGNFFSDEYLSYLCPDYKNLRPDLYNLRPDLCTNNHLRSLFSGTQKSWDRITEILGNKTLAGTFDILYIIRLGSFICYYY